MSFITLVRHGQANSSARDEGSYDRLSDLGWQQARWLGGYLEQTGEKFARVYSGTLRRHVETVEGISPASMADPVQDARLNELAYFDMAQLMEAQHGIAIPGDREEFILHLPQLLTLWRDGALQDVPETWQSFETRVTEALTEIAGGEGRALVVTSGGLIGMAMRVMVAAVATDEPQIAPNAPEAASVATPRLPRSPDNTTRAAAKSSADMREPVVA